MQLAQSRDNENRLSLKSRLANKVEAAITSKPEEETAPQNVVLLLPSNFQELDEQQLHFSLMHNRELQHSRESATMATDIVHGRMLRPKNVTIQSLELANPVEIPQFAGRPAPKRSPGRQLTPDDSSKVILANEEVKRSEYQHYIQNMFQRTTPEFAALVPAQTLRVPANWDTLSETELFFTLTHQTELEHTRTTAYLAMDILSGKIATPAGVTLQEVELFRPVAQPKPEFKVQTIAKPVKQQTVAEFATQKPEEQILLLPKHYEELSQAGLFYTLTHNPELKHSHDTATLAVAFLFGVSSKPEWVQFKTVDITKPVTLTKETPLVKDKADPLDGFIPERELEKRAQYKAFLASQTERVLQAQPETDEELILRLPKNYKELSSDDLLQVLTRNTAYQHTLQSAYQTIDILSGKLAKPGNVKFHTVKLPEIVVKPVVFSDHKVEAAIHPDILANEDAKRLQLKDRLASKAENAFTAKPVEETPKDNTIHRLADLPVPAVKPVILTEPKKVETALHPDQQKNEDQKRLDEAKKKFEAAKAAKAGVEVIAPTELTLLVPDNFTDLSKSELLYTLLNTPELAHDRQSAYDTIDILSGVLRKPANVSFQAVEITKSETVATPRVQAVKADAALHPLQDEASRLKREQHKEFLAEKARVAYNTKPVFKVEAERVVLLPEGYESMSPGELHFALIRNPEFHHTAQQAVVTADMLSGRIGTPSNVRFQTVKVENIQLATATTKPAKAAPVQAAAKTGPTLITRAQLPRGEGDRTLLLPENFESMTEAQLHFALSHNREYGHSYESTYETIDYVFGRAPVPNGTVFDVVPVEDPLTRAY